MGEFSVSSPALTALSVALLCSVVSVRADEARPSRSLALAVAAFAIEAWALFVVAAGSAGTSRMLWLLVLAAAVAITTAAGIGSAGDLRPAQSAQPARAVRRGALALVPRQTWVGLSLAAGLWWMFMRYSRWPSLVKKSNLDFIMAQTAPNTFGEIVPRAGWSYWLQWIPMGINLNENNAIGMAFAFLIGGAVAALVLPSGVVARVRSARGVSGSALGGLLGAPLMMCSACSVPVAMGWRRRGANLETTLGVVGGSALLNVVGLVTIWALFPPGMAWGRIVASLAMVLLVTPAIARVSTATAPEDHAPVGLRLEESATEQEHSWRAASSAAVRRWWWSSVGIAHRMFVPMVLATFLAAFARLLISPEATSEHLGGGFVAIAATALVGTLIAIPTLFEIPLVVGLMALGMGAGPATALLITAPSMSLITWFMLRRETGARPPTLLLIATFALGLIAGLLVEGWSANVG